MVVVAHPKNNTTSKPLTVHKPSVSTANKNGISMIALREKITATAGVGATFSNTSLLTRVYVANSVPATNDIPTPIGFTTTPPLLGAVYCS